jgi:hypothetical protein
VDLARQTLALFLLDVERPEVRALRRALVLRRLLGLAEEVVQVALALADD